ncbi:MAG: hypothetical protein AABY96_08475 [Nitrospirota bacterium]
MRRVSGEFEEIGHSGGKITFEVVTDAGGRRGYQTSFRSSRPVPAVLIELYALADSGVAVGINRRMGMGVEPEPPPVNGCFSVLVASDSEGKFGHTCQKCRGYWRSGPWPKHCPYCGCTAPPHKFLSAAQRRYIHHYCALLVQASATESDGKVVLDMDEVADAVGKEGEKPSFYISEKSQQNKFTCESCEEFNDILGRFGFCSLCGTRNDLSIFERQTVPGVRDRLKTGAPPEDCLRDGVSAFDSFIAQYAKQLSFWVKMTQRRKDRLRSHSFHNLAELRETFQNWFDINVCSGMRDDECHNVSIMFFRRHLYEHNGGEVDQKYLDNTGEANLQVKQYIREKQEDVHELLSSLVKMARNVHSGFHQLLPPDQDPIQAFEDKKKRVRCS